MKAAYYAQVEFIDINLGRVLDALERSGQRENTLIVFTSDHGEMMGDHGLVHKGCRFYEGLCARAADFFLAGARQSGHSAARRWWS